MKNSYARVILPFEYFHDQVRNSPNMSPPKQTDPNLKTHTNIQTAGKSSARSSVGVDNDDNSPPSSPLSTSSSPLSEPPDESETRLRRSARQMVHDQGLRMSFFHLISERLGRSG